MGKTHKFYIEYELNNKNKKYFFSIEYESGDVWVDTKLLPQTALLCAMCDGTAMLATKCGKRSDLKRTMLPMEWVINEWGGHEEIVEAMKKRKKLILKELPTLRKKYRVMYEEDVYKQKAEIQKSKLRLKEWEERYGKISENKEIT